MTAASLVAPLATHSPFHLEATVRVLQRRPANAVDKWERGRYLRLLALSRGLTLIEVRNTGSIEGPDIRLAVRAGDASAGTRAEASATVRRMLGLDIDPAPLQRSVESVATLRATGRALRGMRPPRFASLFEAFASIVPFQQLSLDAGVAIVARLVLRFGSYIDHEGARYHAFPAAARVAAARLDELCSCGLSRQKSLTLIDIARVIESGELGEQDLAGMDTDSALERLTQLRGIGPWSAGLVLLRGLGRLEMFPPGDVGATRGLRALLRLQSGLPLEPLIARFGRQRGYLYFCALGSSLLAGGLIHPACPRH